jgi:hypothetical protein
MPRVRNKPDVGVNGVVVSGTGMLKLRESHDLVPLHSMLVMAILIRNAIMMGWDGFESRGRRCGGSNSIFCSISLFMFSIMIRNTENCR